MKNLPNSLLEIFLTLRNMGATSYLVGGCVRDSFLGLEAKDYDIVTNAGMDDMEAELSRNGWEVKDTGKNFLVLTISKNGEIYEIANFRKDSAKTDGRRPDSVEIGTINDDAERRDFTVNAIYYEPFSSEYLYPIKESKKDLEKKVLRFVGNPKMRLKEDGLRLFRFYRFLKKGFEPHPASLRACREMFNSVYVLQTPERVRLEIERMVL